jgi:hypothetical protein
MMSQSFYSAVVSLESPGNKINLFESSSSAACCAKELFPRGVYNSERRGVLRNCDQVVFVLWLDLRIELGKVKSRLLLI